MSSSGESSSGTSITSSGSGGSRAGSSADRRRPWTREQALGFQHDIVKTANLLLQNPVPTLENLRVIEKLISLFRTLVIHIRDIDDTAPLPGMAALSLSNTRPGKSRQAVREGIGRRSMEAEDPAQTRRDICRKVDAVITSLEEALHCTNLARFRILIMHQLGRLSVGS